MSSNEISPQPKANFVNDVQDVRPKIAEDAVASSNPARGEINIAKSDRDCMHWCTDRG